MKLSRLSFTFFAAIEVAAITFSLAVRAQAQTESILFSFTGTNGENPYPTMLLDSAGNFYGTTRQGGKLSCANSGGAGCGTVFKCSRDHTGTWRQTVLHQFDIVRGGLDPVSPVIQDAAGNLYGTTLYGGLDNGCGGPGCGVVYKLSPSSTGNWRETVLHTFAGPDGQFPLSGLVMDAAGNLYGTTESGGLNDCSLNTPQVAG